MPTYALTVAAASQSYLVSSLHIVESVNNRNTAEFEILSENGSYRPTVDQEIIITEDGVRIFGGHLDIPAEAGMLGEPGLPIVTRVTAVDFNALAGRRFVSGNVPAGTLKAQLQYLEPYLTPYGVTLDAGQVTGPTDMPLIPCDYVQLNSVFDQMSALTGYTYVWEIDYNKVLRMKAPASTAAPFNVTANDGNAIGDVTVEPSQTDYANRVILRFTWAGLAAYAFLITTGNFSNGNTVTLGGTTYTFQTVLVNSANNVLIGATARDSIYHLQQAIEGGQAAGVGTLFGTGTSQNSQAFGYLIGGEATLKAVARTIGASGNSIACLESSTNASWITEGGGGVSTLQFGHDEGLSNVVEANDLTEQGLRGLREKVVAFADIREFGIAQTTCNAILAQSIATYKKAQYLTAQQNIHPGMTQTITLPRRNLSGTWLVTDVEVFTVEKIPRRLVTVVGGTILLRRWQDDARSLMAGGASSTPMTVFLGGGGGGTGAAGGGSYFLGGNAALMVQSASPTWVAADAVRVTIDTTVRGSTAGTVKVRVRARAGNVTARLQNITDASTAGTSSLVTAPGMTWTDANFAVTLAAGSKVYELQVLPGTANVDVAAVGYFE